MARLALGRAPLLLLGSLLAAPAHAGSPDPATSPLRPPDGGGEFVFRTAGPEISPAEENRILTMLDANVAELRSRGLLPPPGVSRGVALVPPLLDWPLVPVNGLADPGYHGISNFLDQNAAGGSILDWNCGNHTYDGHQGIDFFTWPFGWKKMDDSKVAIVAAAPGTIIGKDDGNADRSCDCSSNAWNAVYVQHADGSKAWYGHMKKFSQTSKAIGSAVVTGEFLGLVGSSGCSTGPHLHFQLYDASNALQEPYSGTCNSFNAFSWWRAQRPYYDSAVNELIVGSTPAVMPACPTAETPNEKTIFPRGSTIYFTPFYRDQQAGQLSTYRIKRPDGSIYATWSHSASQYYAASWWYWYYTNVGSSGPDGIWKFEVDFNGTTTVRPFNIGGTPAGRVPGDATTESHLSAAKGAGSGIAIAWPASCLTTDTNYGIYEGPIGSWASHTSLVCSTAGATSFTVTPTRADAYYLVVATNGTKDGSYGTTSAGVERAAAAVPCHPQEIGSCP